MITRNDQLSLKASRKAERRGKVEANKAKKAGKTKRERKGKKGKRGQCTMDVIPGAPALSPSKRNRQLLKKRNAAKAEVEDDVEDVVNPPPPAKKPRKRVKNTPAGQSEVPAASEPLTRKPRTKGKNTTEKQGAPKAKAKASPKAKAKEAKAKDKVIKGGKVDKVPPKRKGRGKQQGADGDEKHVKRTIVDNLKNFALQIGKAWEDIRNPKFKEFLRSKVQDHCEKSRLNIYWSKATCGVHVYETCTDIHHFTFNGTQACAPYRIAVATKCAEAAATQLLYFICFSYFLIFLHVSSPKLVAAYSV